MRISNRMLGFAILLMLLFALQTSSVLAQEQCFFPTAPGVVVYPTDWFPIVLSSEEVARDGDVELSIDFGGPPCPPFTWSVEGTGFTLTDGTTSDGANGLHAEGTACGAAKITVTDDCQRTATGYVRCTTGGWQQMGSAGLAYGLGIPGGPCAGGGGYNCPYNTGRCPTDDLVIITGKWRHTYSWGGYYWGCLNWSWLKENNFNLFFSRNIYIYTPPPETWGRLKTPSEAGDQLGSGGCTCPPCVPGWVNVEQWICQ